MGKCSYRPKNPFRTALALWRVVKDSEDAGANIEEAVIVLFAFNRSRWGRKIARWDLLAQEVGQSSAEAKQLMQNRVRLPEVDLQALAALPIGSVGRTFAAVAAERDIDPNLVEKMPAETDADWLMAYSYETHDLRHLMTGFYYDLEGQFGVAGFFMGQMPKLSFIAFFTAILVFKIIWHDRDALAACTRAFVDGYEMGRQARCLVGGDSASVYAHDLDALRVDWGARSADNFPALSRAA